MRILIVEDDDSIVMMYRRFLIRMGFPNEKIISSQDGFEALEIFKQRPDRIALVILDMLLPKMDGYSIAKEMLKISKVPILMISGCTSGYEMERAIAIGCLNYLTKPIDLNVFANNVDSIIKPVDLEMSDLLSYELSNYSALKDALASRS